MPNLMPLPFFQALDSKGGLLVGGKVYFYEAGTSTPKDTYTDSTLTTANANPVVLGASGDAEIWGNGTYKIVLRDADDVLIHSTDNVELGDNSSASPTLDDTVTSGVSYPLEVIHTTTGTPAVGIGSGIRLTAETAVGNNEIGASIEAVSTDLTDGSEDFNFTVNVMNGGSLSQVLSLDGNGLLTVDNVRSGRDVVSITDNDTLDGANVGYYNRFTGGGGKTITIDTNANQAIDIEAEIELFNATANDVALNAVSGVTVNGAAGSASVTLPSYSGCLLKKNATDNWDYIGPDADGWA